MNIHQCIGKLKCFHYLPICKNVHTYKIIDVVSPLCIIIIFFICGSVSFSYCNYAFELLTYLLYFSRTLLPSTSSGYTIGRRSFTQLLTSVIGIPIPLYNFGISSSQRFCGLPFGRLPTGWITSAFLWGAVGAILVTTT